MTNTLYLLDLYSIQNADVDFLTDFMRNQAVGVITDACSDEIPQEWLKHAVYVFSCDGYELYIKSVLRYKYTVTYTPEVNNWLNSLDLPITKYTHKIFISCDPYTSTQLVRNFNELFSEFRAYSCKDGLYVSDTSNPKKHITSLISSDYDIALVTSNCALGGSSFDLAASVSKQGCVYAISNFSDLQQLLLELLKK